MTNEIVPTEVTAIQHATAEEISSLNEKVIEATSDVARANTELDVLAESLTTLNSTVNKYNKVKGEVRKMMQNLATKM